MIAMMIPDADSVSDQNTPPVVTILLPEDQSNFEWNSLMRYAIRVSDAEDGESEYEEIAPNEVFFEVTYLSSLEAVASVRNRSDQLSPAGLTMMQSSDCFSCHASRTRIAGPSFHEIANRYAGEANVAEKLANSIIKGSSELWGSVMMPPHPALDPVQAKAMAEWILDLGSDPDRDIYQGTEGAFRTRARPKDDGKGWYLLVASYTDHGLPERPELRLRGQDVVVLQRK